MKFEARDPFPLLPKVTKTEALAHAADVDQWLVLRVIEIERELAARGSSKPAPTSSGAHQNLWFGLEPRDLQTPYVEIRALLTGLPPFTHAVDLGAAYARMGFVIERHFPYARFTGFEYVGERVAEARRALQKFGASRAHVEHVDLTSSSFAMPRADLYFIYDYGTPAAIEKTLHDVRRASEGRRVHVVARGRVCRYAIESRHAFWLAKPEGPESTVTVYSSVGSDRDTNAGLRDRSTFDGIEAPVENRV